MKDLESLRKLQLAEFEILKKIIKVCTENDIRYFLDSGTLIGAVRHKGFIPWDDDIDIAMPYADFIRFQQIAQDELGPGFFVQNYLTDKNYYRQYAKVRNVNTTAFPPTWKNWDIAHGAWVDIFPMFYADTEKQIKKAQKAVRRVRPLQGKNYVKTCLLPYKKSLRVILKYITYSIVAILPLKTRRNMQTKLIGKSFSAPSGKYLCRSDVKLFRFRSEWYNGEDTYLEFEGEKMRVPNNYDEVLRFEYGDYMQLPPEEKRHQHGQMVVDLETPYKVYLKKGDKTE